MEYDVVGQWSITVYSGKTVTSGKANGETV